MEKGDILVGMWGYSCTGVNFYEVIKATEKTLTLIAIDKKIETGPHCLNETMPIPGSYNGEPFRRRIVNDRAVPGCRIDDCVNAYLWDGTPQLETRWA